MHLIANRSAEVNDPVTAAALAYRAGKLDFAAFIRQTAGRLRKIVAHVAHRYAGYHMTEDVRFVGEEICQQLYLRLFERILPEYDGVRDINPLIYASTENIARGMRNRFTARSIAIDHKEDGQDEDSGDKLQSETEEDLVSGDRAYRQIAIEKFRQRLIHERNHMNQNGVSTLLIGAASLPPFFSNEQVIYASRSAQQDRRENMESSSLSPEAIELKQIQESLALTIPQFALALAPEVAAASTLNAYLYGRTLHVPANVMTKARELAARGNPLLDEKRRRFGDRNMREIVQFWAEQLGYTELDSRGQNTIAIATGVNPITVRRWTTSDVMPDLDKIIQYDDSFHRFQAERGVKPPAR